MQDIKSIEARLFELADRQLKEDVDRAFEEADKLLRDGTSWGIVINSAYDESHPPQFTKEVPWWQAVKSLKEKAIEKHTARYREKALADFMEKISRFAQDYEAVASLVED